MPTFVTEHASECKRKQINEKKKKYNNADIKTDYDTDPDNNNDKI